jgi:hypothetical protein
MTLEAFEENSNNTCFVIPDEVVLAFGRGRRVPVVATVGEHSWRTTIVSMGGRFLLGVNAAQRKATGLRAGDTADVAIEVDDAPREVEVPPELAAALAADPAAAAAWERLSYTHRKEHARAVAEAKAEETKARRVAKALDMLRAKG